MYVHHPVKPGFSHYHRASPARRCGAIQGGAAPVFAPVAANLWPAGSVHPWFAGKSCPRCVQCGPARRHKRGWGIDQPVPWPVWPADSAKVSATAPRRHGRKAGTPPPVVGGRKTELFSPVPRPIAAANLYPVCPGGRIARSKARLRISERHGRLGNGESIAAAGT